MQVIRPNLIWLLVVLQTMLHVNTLEEREREKNQTFILVHHNKLEELVSELSASLNNIKHEQEFMEVRERIHRSSKSLNRDVDGYHCCVSS